MSFVLGENPFLASLCSMNLMVSTFTYLEKVWISGGCEINNPRCCCLEHCSTIGQFVTLGEISVIAH